MRWYSAMSRPDRICALGALVLLDGALRFIEWLEARLADLRKRD